MPSATGSLGLGPLHRWRVWGGEATRSQSANREVIEPGLKRGSVRLCLFFPSRHDFPAVLFWCLPSSSA